jgi:hypothetical protein
MGGGCKEYFQVPVSSMDRGDPAELQLTTQCMRWVSVKGTHKEGRLRLTCGLKRLLLYEGGERGRNCTS